MPRPSRFLIQLTMMDVHWLEQTDGDVPPGNDWLSSSEVVRLSNLRFAKRRGDWRLGRWTAKRALAVCLNVPDDLHSLAAIEIRPATSGAPEAFFADQPAGAGISLSHCSGRAICVVAFGAAALGCDLETIEERSEAFVADYFTAEEQALVARAEACHRAALVALLWSGKESALKALNTGLRLDTRSVAVSPGSSTFNQDGWHPLQVCCADDQVFDGWWLRAGHFVQTMVSVPSPNPPVQLQSRGYCANRVPVRIEDSELSVLVARLH